MVRLLRPLEDRFGVLKLALLRAREASARKEPGQRGRKRDLQHNSVSIRSSVSARLVEEVRRPRADSRVHPVLDREHEALGPALLKPLEQGPLEQALASRGGEDGGGELLGVADEDDAAGAVAEGNEGCRLRGLGEASVRYRTGKEGLRRGQLRLLFCPDRTGREERSDGGTWGERLRKESNSQARADLGGLVD